MSNINQQLKRLHEGGPSVDEGGDLGYSVKYSCHIPKNKEGQSRECEPWFGIEINNPQNLPIKSFTFSVSARKGPNGEYSSCSMSHTIDFHQESLMGRRSPPVQMRRSPSQRPLRPVCYSPQQPSSMAQRIPTVGSQTTTYWSSAGLGRNGPASSLPANVNIGPEDRPVGPFRTGDEWWNVNRPPSASSTHSDIRQELNDDTQSESSQSSCGSDE